LKAYGRRCEKWTKVEQALRVGTNEEKKLGGICLQQENVLSAEWSSKAHDRSSGVVTDQKHNKRRRKIQPRQEKEKL